MANDLNLCQFIGRLGKSPEQRYLASGDAVVNFSLAVGWKGKDKEGVEWVSVVAFGKLAEIIAKYCDKGHQVYVSGKIRTRKWQDKDGNDKYTTEIVADQLQMLGGKNDGDQRPSQDQSKPDIGGGAQYTEEPFEPDEEIPF